MFKDNPIWDNGFFSQLLPLCAKALESCNVICNDIILQGVPWEMKSPVEAGKYTIKNIVQNASHQSVNIIIDLRRCKMMDDEAIRKICSKA